MQIIQKIAAWTADQPVRDYDAEVLTDYSRMIRGSNFMQEGGAKVLPRSSESRCVCAR